MSKSDYIKIRRSLDRHKIVSGLKDAEEMYLNGGIVEAGEILGDIAGAIKEFAAWKRSRKRDNRFIERRYGLCDKEVTDAIRKAAREICGETPLPEIGRTLDDICFAIKNFDPYREEPF